MYTFYCSFIQHLHGFLKINIVFLVVNMKCDSMYTAIQDLHSTEQFLEIISFHPTTLLNFYIILLFSCGDSLF